MAGAGEESRAKGFMVIKELPLKERSIDLARSLPGKAFAKAREVLLMSARGP